MEYSVKAYAKVNVGLKVGEKREDGYHPLTTYFHLISLCDDLYLDISPAAKTTVTIIGNEAYTKMGDVDLMERAALLYSKERAKTFALKIRIEKHIPFGAGLGGGSSDAAAVLKTLAKYYDDKESLQALALQLGSDVPFFTSGLCAAKGEGRGEILTPIKAVGAKAVLLMPRAKKISTGWAYAELDKREAVSLKLPAWSEDCEKWFDLYENDFLLVQSGSECTEKRERYRLMLSGSGACFFTILGKDQDEQILKDEFLASELFSVQFLNNI